MTDGYESWWRCGVAEVSKKKEIQAAYAAQQEGIKKAKAFAEKEGVTGELVLEPEECGKAVLAVCSGLLDAVNGQTITVDYGLPFQDNLMMRYLRMKDTKNNDQE